MPHTSGVHARLQIEQADGTSVPLEMALGPSESLGDLENVVERFAEAYCLSVDAEAFEVEQIRLCLFDPEALLVGFDETDDGHVDPAQAMSKRFAFAFVAMLEDRYHLEDPWLVVRPCTREQVTVWHGLMSLDERYSVQAWCLDQRLTDRFQKKG